MLTNPRIGQSAEIRYGPRLRPSMVHLHGRRGIVIVRSTGRPRNHLVQVDGNGYVVPCGNLVSVKQANR